MKHFPGRTIEEITTLAADIMANKGENNSASAYVDNVLLPIRCNVPGDFAYDNSTIENCAEKIATQLDRFGFVDIS